MMKLRSFILAGFLFVSLPLASSFAAVGVAINIAPPVLPVVAQPPCPVAGYIWTPGYWGWGGGGYYWVPGVWVAPPAVGLLWTPPWWGWNNGVYVFNEGYWGPTVGFYGGINYGYGYFGSGYWGGHWEGDSFRYNTAVTRVNTNVVHNTYVDQSVNRQVNTSRAAFNGPNGVKAEPTAEQRAAGENARKMPATSEQRARQEAAARDRNLQASVNKGQPKEDAIRSFNQREQRGKGAGAEGPGAGTRAGQAENKPGNAAERQRKEARTAGERGNKRETDNQQRKRNVEGSKGKPRSGKTAKHEGSARGPHQMTQKSRQPKMSAQGQQMGGKRPPVGGNRGPATEQQKGKKKSGKPEKQHGRY
jgi:YXWGXW repeat-containing protein